MQYCLNAGYLGLYNRQKVGVIQPKTGWGYTFFRRDKGQPIPGNSPGAHPNDTPQRETYRNSYHSNKPVNSRYQNTKRGKQGSNPAPRHSDNRNSNWASAFNKERFPFVTAPIPGSSKVVFRQNREAPHKKTPIVNHEQYVGRINNNLDPASNDFLCSICLPGNFYSATFASGTHALAYTCATYLDMGKLADAIFSAKTTKEVHDLSRHFPNETSSWQQYAEDVLWEILKWKMANVPAFSNRLSNSGNCKFMNLSFDKFWGKGMDGKGSNQIKILPTFRDYEFGLGDAANLQHTSSSGFF